MTQVSVRQARDNLSQLIKDVQEGAEVIIANHGQPVARLVPIRGHRGIDIVTWMETNPMPTGSRRTPDEIDADIADERDSWE